MNCSNAKSIFGGLAACIKGKPTPPLMRQRIVGATHWVARARKFQCYSTQGSALYSCMM